MKVSFDLYRAIRYGFRTFFEHFWFLVMVGIVIGLVRLGANIIINFISRMVFGIFYPSITLPLTVTKEWVQAFAMTQPLFGFIITLLIMSILYSLLSVWWFGALYNVLLKIRDTGSAMISDLFSFINLLPQMLILFYLVGLVMALGFVVLIIPGIYWLVRTYFWWLIILDKKQPGLESIKTSLSLTRNKGWSVFALAMVNVLLFFSIAFASIVLFISICRAIPNFQAAVTCMASTLLLWHILCWVVLAICLLIQVDVYRQLKRR